MWAGYDPFLLTPVPAASAPLLLTTTTVHRCFCLSSTILVKNQARMSLLVLSGADVDGVAASMTPDQLQLLMAQVFARLSASSKARSGVINIHMPPRIVLPTENHTALFMPARIGRVPATTSDSAVTNDEGSDMSIIGTAVKVVCVPNESDPRGLPGTTLVLDEVTGAVKAVVNARKLTALRNAAGWFHSSFLFSLILTLICRVASSSNNFKSCQVHCCLQPSLGLQNPAT